MKSNTRRSLAAAVSEFASAYAHAHGLPVQIIASHQSILVSVADVREAAPADFIGTYTAEHAEDQVAVDMINHWGNS